jgi:hypothetical protein
MGDTDRDLLELAAKAYGFGAPGTGAVCWTESEYPRGSGKYGALWNYVGFGDAAQLWNPLTDDGDALRLAVKLRLTISPDPFNDEDYIMATPPGTHQGYDCIVNQDPFSAARRAIVRAAAEIGRSKS